jgi:hypothetical protein
MGEAENELRDLPRRIARERVLERVPTLALSRDSLVFPYVAAHVQRPDAQEPTDAKHEARKLDVCRSRAL